MSTSVQSALSGIKKNVSTSSLSLKETTTTTASLDDSSANVTAATADDCSSYDNDDHNNNYIQDQSEGDENNLDYNEEEDEDSNCNNYDHNDQDNDDDGADDEDDDNHYTNDPEYFEYESYPIERLDWIVEKKCEALNEHLKLDDPFDVLTLLRQFKWNHQTLIEAYKKDRTRFLSTYLFSDDNNNNNEKVMNKTSVNDFVRLVSYVGIFSGSQGGESAVAGQSRIQSRIGRLLASRHATHLKRPVDMFCNICCSTQVDELVTLDDCGVHFFCLDCWSLHFETHIKQGAGSLFECMQTKCSALASKDFVLRCLQASSLVGNCARKKQLSERYRKLIGKSMFSFH
jgi:hypothetical protein